MKTRFRLSIVDSALKILSGDLAGFGQKSKDNYAISIVDGAPR